MSPPLDDAAVPTAAQLLRHATREAHDAVEQVPLMRELGAARLDVDAYRQVLRRYHAILAGWEQALHGWLATLAAQGWAYRWRQPALAADLRALQADEPPRVPLPAVPATAAARWGMLYVVEGSQLGGRLIARGLRAQRPALAGALRYFELGDADPGAWRRFQERLEHALGGAAARDEAIAGARAMFAHFHFHLAAECAP